MKPIGNTAIELPLLPKKADQGHAPVGDAEFVAMLEERLQEEEVEAAPWLGGEVALATTPLPATGRIGPAPKPQAGPDPDLSGFLVTPLGVVGRAARPPSRPPVSQKAMAEAHKPPGEARKPMAEAAMSSAPAGPLKAPAPAADPRRIAALAHGMGDDAIPQVTAGAPDASDAEADADGSRVSAADPAPPRPHAGARGQGFTQRAQQQTGALPIEPVTASMSDPLEGAVAGLATYDAPPVPESAPEVQVIIPPPPDVDVVEVDGEERVRVRISRDLSVEVTTRGQKVDVWLAGTPGAIAPLVGIGPELEASLLASGFDLGAFSARQEAPREGQGQGAPAPQEGQPGRDPAPRGPWRGRYA